MTARRLVAASVAVAASLVATVACADDPTPTERLPQRYPPSSIRLPLAIGGLAVAGAAYGLGAFVGNQSPDVPGSGSLVVPVVGPWIALGRNACPPDDPDCGGMKTFRGIMLAFDGVVQIAGLAMIGEAIFLKTEAGSGRDKKTSLLEMKRGDLSMRATPIGLGRGSGLGVTGTF